MKILPVPLASPPTRGCANQYVSSYLVNDHIAVDAGTIGFYDGPQEQAKIRHVFLSHSHIDHLGSLPIFLENIAGLTKSPVNLYASEAVQESLRLDLFNGRLWPNFLVLTHSGNVPFVKLHTIASGQAVDVEGMRILPVAVNHVVPTLGFMVSDATGAVALVSDTGPTQEVWTIADQTPNLKAVFLEATFPDAMTGLADISLHLTPGSFVREMQKLQRAVPFYAVHLKARFREQVIEELLAHKLPNLLIAELGKIYEF